MAHHKRKRSKRSVKCTICTPHRWHGNSKERHKAKEQAEREQANKDIEDS